MTARRTVRANRSASWRTGGSAGLARRLHEDWGGHRRSWTSAGFQALAVYRLAAWQHQLPGVARLPVTALQRPLAFLVRRFRGIDLSPRATIGRRLSLDHRPVVVGPGSEIGDDCRLGRGVMLLSGPGPDSGAPRLGHQVEIGATTVIRGRVIIGDGARIGAGVDVGPGAAILGAVSVGDGACIGADAVVIGDVPAGGSEFATADRRAWLWSSFQPGRDLALHDRSTTTA